MSEQLEGVVEQISPRTDKGEGGVRIDGEWYNYTKSEKRKDPWEPPTDKGQRVKIAFDRSVYNDKEYRWVNQIKVTAAGQGASPAGGSPDIYTSLHRLEALKLAQAMRLHGVDGGLRLDQAGAEVVALADVYARFIGGNFEQPGAPEPPDSDPGWE